MLQADLPHHHQNPGLVVNCFIAWYHASLLFHIGYIGYIFTLSLSTSLQQELRLLFSWHSNKDAFTPKCFLCLETVCHPKATMCQHFHCVFHIDHHELHQKSIIMNFWSIVVLFIFFYLSSRWEKRFKSRSSLLGASTNGWLVNRKTAKITILMRTELDWCRLKDLIQFRPFLFSESCII